MARAKEWPTSMKCPAGSNIVSDFTIKDQPIFPGTRSFVFADDLAVVAQDSHFDTIERTNALERTGKPVNIP